MQLQINGEYQTVPNHISVDCLITHLGFAQYKLAVEVNRKIIPADQHSNTLLSNNDIVEIIYAVGGG